MANFSVSRSVGEDSTADSESLTEPSLLDLLCRKRKYREHFRHDLNQYARQRLEQPGHFGINMKALEENRDAIDKVDECVIACTDTKGRLASIETT
jgi:hypothetical protein